MFDLISMELYKIRKRQRSYIGFAAIAVVVSIIQFALYVDGQDYVEFITMQIEQTFTINGTIINGNLVAYVILKMLIVQMPLLVAIVTGDLVSGEAANGTIRLLATKPVSRHNIIMAKFIAGSVYTIALILWLGIFSLGLGLLFFGNGDLIVLNSDGISILRSSATFPRFMAAMVVAFVSLTVVGSFSMMLSCFSDNSLGPILATMSVIIIFTIIGSSDFTVARSSP